MCLNGGELSVKIIIVGKNLRSAIGRTGPWIGWSLSLFLPLLALSPSFLKFLHASPVTSRGARPGYPSGVGRGVIHSVSHFRSGRFFLPAFVFGCACAKFKVQVHKFTSPSSIQVLNQVICADPVLFCSSQVQSDKSRSKVVFPARWSEIIPHPPGISRDQRSIVFRPIQVPHITLYSFNHGEGDNPGLVHGPGLGTLYWNGRFTFVYCLIYLFQI